MLAPCKDCEKRSEDCRKTCEDYLVFQVYGNMITNTRRKMQKEDDDFYKVRKSHSRKRGFGW